MPGIAGEAKPELELRHVLNLAMEGQRPFSNLAPPVVCCVQAIGANTLNGDADVRAAAADAIGCDLGVVVVPAPCLSYERRRRKEAAGEAFGAPRPARIMVDEADELLALPRFIGDRL